MSESTAAHSPNLGKSLLKTAGILLAFVLLADLLLSGTQKLTQERIAQEEEKALLAQLGEVFPASLYDNDLVATQQLITDKSLGTDQPVRIYLALQHNHPAGIIYATRSHKGYSGEIQLLIGIDYRGVIQGVRVLGHKETPGLGDKIETSKHPWMTQFTGLFLGEPKDADWAVKKDGGAFDQFTGATITPRAVVAAIKATLEYHKAHQAQLLSDFLKGGQP